MSESENQSSILDDGGIDTDARAGRSQGIEPDKEPDEDTKKEMEEERQRRLDPENRPENAEVDNTGRTFDTARGKFTDSDEYDESADAPYTDPEAPENTEGTEDTEGSESGGNPSDQVDDDELDDGGEGRHDRGDEERP